MEVTNTLYGAQLIPVSQKDRMIAFTELSKGIGIKTDANVKSYLLDYRRVDMWRIPLDSGIGEIFKRVGDDANKAFNYNANDIGDIQYLEYKVGDYYNIHSDIDNGQACQRKISMSWVLNSDYEGGDFKIYEHGDSTVINLTPSNVLAFTSFYNHSVSMVTSGIRKALVCWYIGDSWK